MSRLYKNCFFASGGGHVLLALILITCPAFLASNPKPSDVQPIIFIPDIVTSSAFSGGGSPDADRPVAPTPTTPAPTPAPAPATPPPQPKPAVKEFAPPKPNEESLEVAKDSKPTRRKPEVSTTAVVIKPRSKTPPKDTTAEDNLAREQEAKMNRVASAFDHAAGSIKSGTGSAAKLYGSRGPGGGGPSYAGYASWVLTIFDKAWVAPDDASSEDATILLTIIIIGKLECRSIGINPSRIYFIISCRNHPLQFSCNSHSQSWRAIRGNIDRFYSRTIFKRLCSTAYRKNRSDTEV